LGYRPSSFEKEFLSAPIHSPPPSLVANPVLQDFELPTIKLNKDKVEVIPTVSQTSPPDLVTQLSAITDRFERAFNDQSSLVASVLTRLEKIEGKCVLIYLMTVSLK
jgi:hypothetical protein